MCVYVHVCVCVHVCIGNVQNVIVGFLSPDWSHDYVFCLFFCGQFSDAQGKYKVCLCPGGECQSAYLQMVAGSNGSTVSLGSFQKMDVVGFATGPQVLFTGGERCGQGSARSQAHVFMECDRTVANQVGTLVAEKVRAFFFFPFFLGGGKGCGSYFEMIVTGMGLIGAATLLTSR